MSDLHPGGWTRWSAIATSLAVIVLATAGCGQSAPSSSASSAPTASPSSAPTELPATSLPSAGASPSPVSSADVAAIYDAIEEQVIEIRGLKPTKPVARETITEAESRALLTSMFDKESPPAYVAANERLYKALGLIPADSSLRDLTLDLLSGAVVGIYRNDQGKLYMVSKTGLPGVNERITFAHEYDHALQDQNFPVFKDQEGVLDQSDWILARQAVYEGDGVLLMSVWAAAHFSPQDLLELIALSADPATQALLDRTPAFLRELLEYPYSTGLTYVQAAQLRGGWEAANDLFRRMPESTEQILHSEKYVAQEAPIKVTLPEDLASQLGSGWSVPLEDTFGELQLGFWLSEAGVAPATAKAAAAGWGGDRLAVVKGPSDAWGVVIETTWDTKADATEFADAAGGAVDGLANPARISAPAGSKVTILIASDEASLLRLDVIFGGTGV